MIDFIKAEVEGFNLNKFTTHPLLNWESKIECESPDTLGKFVQARFKGLLFRLIFPTLKRKDYILTVEGSLHKFWNNGEHNFNDFNQDALRYVLEELNCTFYIKPQNLYITQIEIGVNIQVHEKTKNILSCCLMHKKEQFKWVSLSENSNYIQAMHRTCIIKIYDKQLQYSSKGYDLKDEIMRFELKMKRPYFSRILNKYSRITLQDILDFGLINFKKELLNAWDYVLFYDAISLDNTDYAERYSNIHFWLRQNIYQYRYHRENLNSRIKKNSLSLKKEIRNQISSKIDLLTTLVEPYNILSSRVV